MLKAKSLIYLKNLSLTKLINLSKIGMSYLLSLIIREPVRKAYPYSISIEPTTSCNLHCPQCPVGMNKLNRPAGNMSIELYKKIIDETAPYLLNLFLYFQGEPFLNNNFFEFIKYAKQNKITTLSSTNGHFLNENNIKQLIVSQLDILIISLDGTSQSSYQKYRRGGEFDKVVKGIKLLTEMKKKMKSTKPFVEIQFIVFKHNEQEIEKIKALGKLLHVDKVAIKTAQVYDFENDNEFIPNNTKYSRYKKVGGKWQIKKKIKNHCFRLWNSSVITWDGRVLPCCFDKDAKYAFGNVKTEKLKDIISNDKFKKFAKQVLTDRKKIDICNNCTE